MNKLSIIAISLSSVAFSPFSTAENQTVTTGYAQSKFQDFGDIKGGNLKYRYEWDSPFSIIGSFTYMSSKFDQSYSEAKDKIEHHVKLTYYSLSAGPAYRFNDYISLYGLIAGLTGYRNYQSEIRDTLISPEQPN
ncbi:Ail/Lom family outer membrane beta-barrel protein [Pantoea sp. BAV 3049]|uniref:Ail/Lom family outer membrane beta-barrel protein n=1 Tax=Pantoea sp. BAV 3049 TaxID=2654188 RepID=UPI00131AD57D|nr:Ail/Lom family outer membrane beta-barrel protein [Pantoea sp. BAV 3049]